MVVKPTGLQRVPDFVQHSPRKIPTSFLSSKASGETGSGTTTACNRKKLISIAPENGRIHAIVERLLDNPASGPPPSDPKTLEYHVFTLNGKTVSSHRLPILSQGCPRPAYDQLAYTCPAERPLLLRDSAGVVFPFLPTPRSGQEPWVFPQWLDLPSIQCAALSWLSPSCLSAFGDSQANPSPGATDSNLKKNKEAKSRIPRILFGVIVVSETSLMQYIVRAEDQKVEEALRSLATSTTTKVQSVVHELADGHRNILHMAVLMCAPQSNREAEWSDRLVSILANQSEGKFKNLELRNPGQSWNLTPTSKPLFSLLNLGSSRSGASGLTMHDLFIRSSIEAVTTPAHTTSDQETQGDVVASQPAFPSAPPTTTAGSNFWYLPPVSTDDFTRRQASYRILRLLLRDPTLRPYLRQLLSSVTDDGMTPFMLAIQCKAYQVANFLLDFLVDLENIRPESQTTSQFSYSPLMKYLFPPSSCLDDSPLFMLCYNDTCSFTWTGPNHIRLDIFECRTCGLMDSLCCCTECARVCHKGHDCRLKRTSPTAYCDCWEKCCCRSLILGSQSMRLSLFERLLRETDLVYLPNGRGEHLMVYLTKSVERQCREQKQYRPSRRRLGPITSRSVIAAAAAAAVTTTPTGANADAPTSASPLSGRTQSGGVTSADVTGRGNGGASSDEPEHDLEPPTFCRDALELVLESKSAAASLLCGDGPPSPSKDEQPFMAIQSGASQLDEFVFTLLCKCPPELLHRLLSTLSTSLEEHLSAPRREKNLLRFLRIGLQQPSSESTSVDHSDSSSSFLACRHGIARFVRSVARVYTSIVLGLAPDHYKKKPRLSSQSQPLELCRLVFLHLAPVACVELSLLAVGLLSPVRTGGLRPSAIYTLTSQTNEAIHAFDQVITSERVQGIRRQPAVNSFDCPNGVVRRLMYKHPNHLPSWIAKQHCLAASVTTGEEGAKIADDGGEDSSASARNNSSAVVAGAASADSRFSAATNKSDKAGKDESSTTEEDSREVSVATQVRNFNVSAMFERTQPVDLSTNISSEEAAGIENFTTPTMNLTAAPDDVACPDSESDDETAVDMVDTHSSSRLRSVIGNDRTTGSSTSLRGYTPRPHRRSYRSGFAMDTRNPSNKSSLARQSCPGLHPIEMDAEGEDDDITSHLFPPDVTESDDQDPIAEALTVDLRPLNSQHDSDSEGTDADVQSTELDGDSTQPLPPMAPAPLLDNSDSSVRSTGRDDTVTPMHGVAVSVAEDDDENKSVASSSRPALATTSADDQLMDGSSAATTLDVERRRQRKNFSHLSEYVRDVIKRVSEEPARTELPPSPKFMRLLSLEGQSRQGPIEHQLTSGSYATDTTTSSSTLDCFKNRDDVSDHRRSSVTVYREVSDSQASAVATVTDDNATSAWSLCLDASPTSLRQQHCSSPASSTAATVGTLGSVIDLDMGSELGGGNPSHGVAGGEVDNTPVTLELNEMDRDDRDGARRELLSTYPPVSDANRSQVEDEPMVTVLSASASEADGSELEDAENLVATADYAEEDEDEEDEEEEELVADEEEFDEVNEGEEDDDDDDDEDDDDEDDDEEVDDEDEEECEVDDGQDEDEDDDDDGDSSQHSDDQSPPPYPPSPPWTALGGSGSGVTSSNTATSVVISSTAGDDSHPVRGSSRGLPSASATSSSESPRTYASVARAAPTPGTSTTSSVPRRVASAINLLGVPSPSQSAGINCTTLADNKEFGMHITQIQLSRAFACIMRLLADCMVDLNNEQAASSLLRRCVSAPVFLSSLSTDTSVPATKTTFSFGTDNTRATTGSRQHNFSFDGAGTRILYLKSLGLPSLGLSPTSRSLPAVEPVSFLQLSVQDQAAICASVGYALAPVWAWLVGSMDSLESQLRFRALWSAPKSATENAVTSEPTEAPSGRRRDQHSERGSTSVAIDGSEPASCQTNNSPCLTTPTSQPGLASTNCSVFESGSGGTGLQSQEGGIAPVGASVGTASGSSRQDFLTYLLSVMRSAANEHHDTAPNIDITSHKHTAYIVDAFLYLFKAFEMAWPSGLCHHLRSLHQEDPLCIDTDNKNWRDNNAQTVDFPGPLAQRTDAFFRRSDSTLSLAGAGLDPVLTPVSEALPLAVYPQRLQPTSRRSDLFGTARRSSENILNLPTPVDVDPEHSTWSDMLKVSDSERPILMGGEFLDHTAHAGSVLARWCASLEAFSQKFSDDVGTESRSYMVELGRFTDKEARFRKEMERLRNATRRDLTLVVDREPRALLLGTVRQLNVEFNKRVVQGQLSNNLLRASSEFERTPLSSSSGTLQEGGASRVTTAGRGQTMSILSSSTNSTALNNVGSILQKVGAVGPVLACHRIKVTFRDEPGEGSGVARSFITAFSEMVLSERPLPELSSILQPPPTAETTVGLRGSTSSSAGGGADHHISAPFSVISTATITLSTPGTERGGSTNRHEFSSTSSVPRSLSVHGAESNNGDAMDVSYPGSSQAKTTVSMSFDRDKAGEKSMNTPQSASLNQSEDEDAAILASRPERAPLFWQPGLGGFYSPRAVSQSPSIDSAALQCRYTIYRCIGRVIGLCLLTNETCPLRFNRHVLKYILGRPLCWHDFAFFDSTVYEGLRQLLLYTTPARPEGTSDSILDYNLTFSLLAAPEEGGSVRGPSAQHPLVPGGDKIDVNSVNIYEFVKRYAEFKMREVINEPLEHIRLGVFDVLPHNALDGLTSEDLRLLLNGVSDINVDTLVGYTTFLDESGASAFIALSEGTAGSGVTVPNAADRVARLKRWFWNVVRSMDARQRQDLLYFWTSSPALPASAHGFQPMPTITIRPPDDQHLPTANTCISRLYLPLYSSKQILREKLLQAIQTKGFGFV